MGRVSRDFTVATDPQPELARLGWRMQDGDGCLEAVQGSQVKTRILGGWFVRPRDLPKSVTVRPSPDGSGFLVRVTETFGLGFLDRRFRERYEQAFDDLERQLANRSP